MTDELPVDPAIGLDAEQRAVADADPGERQIVLAAPGSGKTEVVAARVDALDTLHGLDPVDEVLVLSFSRAAVAALRSRLGPRSQGPLPTIRTIDSTASMLLDEMGVEDWGSLDFDHRIERVTRALREGGGSETLSLVRHVIVDEVQDLVGLRARFVRELLKALPEDAGFTLLGDPRQALYDFQLAGEGDTTAEGFLEEASALAGSEVVTRTRLKGQYRARSADARSVAALGAGDLEGSAWVHAVEDRLEAVLTVGDVTDVARPVARWGGTTAFLCRTNGDALLVAGAMREAGVTARLRPRAEAQPLEPWVATAVSDGGPTVAKTELVERLEGAVRDPELAWRLLKATERNFHASDRLDVARLAARVDLGDFPAALVASPGPLVVSTVHRAKGLEFDHVVVIDPEGLRGSENTPVAYVALTRARDRLFAAGLTRPKFLRRDEATGRWYVGGHQRWMTSAFELRSEDVAADPDVSVEPSDVGRDVMALFDRHASTTELPVWKLSVGDRRLGRTTPEFGALVARRVRPGRVGSRWGWPDMGAIGIDGIVTGVVHNGAGRPSLTRVPSISGMATLLR